MNAPAEEAPPPEVPSGNSDEPAEPFT
jgi:hypothetical protein